MREYLTFTESVASDVKAFKAKQSEAVVREEIRSAPDVRSFQHADLLREEVFLKEWELEKSARKEAPPSSDHAGKVFVRVIDPKN